MVRGAPPSHRQTLTSAQLSAAYAALPPLPPRSRPTFRRGPSIRLSFIPPQDHQNTLPPPPIITSITAPAPSSHRQTLSSAQLLAAYTALPSLNPQSTSRPQAVSVYNIFFIMLFN
jgi:VanZ family protein